MNAMRTTLSDGYDFSKIIKGCWQMSAGHTVQASLDRERLMTDTIAYVREGIDTLDFGDIYTGVERLVGETLTRMSDKQRNGVRLHTKYVPDQSLLESYDIADVDRIIDRSRERLGVDRLDLVQFHWWEYEQSGYLDAMRRLFELKDQGSIRHVGVTNFNAEHVEKMVDNGLKPATVQVQYSLLDRRPEKRMQALCKQHDIRMLCYGTVAGGFLSDRYLDQPEPKPPFETRSMTKYKLIIDEFGGWEAYQELLRTLKDIADKHDASVSMIASAYVLSRPQVGAAIIGVRNTNHLEEHVSIADISLDEEDLAAIETILDRSGHLEGDVYDLERYDQTHAEIMHKNNNAK